MSKIDSKLNDIIENFNQTVHKPEVFLNPDESLSSKIKSNLKQTYDLSKNEEIKSIKSNALPELIVQNFDLEQIWQQIELQNDTLLSHSLTNVSKLIVGKDRLVFTNLKNELNNTNPSEDEEVDDTNSVDKNADELIENENSNAGSDDLSLNEEDLSDNNGSDDNNKPTTSNRKFIKPSIVDDEFFKLNEMENFLNAEEKKLADPDSGNDSENSESESEDEEGSINLFEDNSEDEDDPMKTARYKDYFVENNVEEKKTKRNKFLEGVDDDEESDNDRVEVDKNIKSTLELRQERLKKKIDQLEGNAIGEKPWQLKGEVRAENRPQNSLLEEVVEFDLTSRPAPVITEQTTLQLEDIIRQRIKDKVFDSVERKTKPADTPLEFKKKLVLDQEKSKQSLAQIYEKDYLEQQAALDPDQEDKEEEEPALHKEIKTMMKSLFNKLDALSNFHFTPKPAVPELKIVSNLPAINMEEVAPVSTSDAALLAPEEVRNKAKGEGIGKSERSNTDKKRQRRQKKLKQREHAQKKEKRETLVNKMRPGLGNKYSKEKTKKLLEKVTKDKNVDKMDETTGKSVKSSKAFFTQLQEEVSSHINSKLQKKSKNNKTKIEAKKIKL